MKTENKEELVLNVEPLHLVAMQSLVCKRFPTVEVLAEHLLTVGLSEYLKVACFFQSLDKADCPEEESFNG